MTQAMIHVAACKLTGIQLDLVKSISPLAPESWIVEFTYFLFLRIQKRSIHNSSSIVVSLQKRAASHENQTWKIKL
ncbi:hypothetical protein STEG23_000380, partial [Scotinomys teguina]